MRRPTLQQDGASAPGQDSFLDTLTNIVGILIILVMVVGLRVKNAPVEQKSSSEAVQTELAGLAQDRDAAASLRGDVLKVEQKMEAVRRETVLRDAERVHMATAVSAIKRALEDRRQNLDAEAQKGFDLKRTLSESRAELTLLQDRRSRAQRVDASPKIIETYPTPLSRPVDNHEAHFQLREGRIVFVPMQSLLEEFKADARAKASNLLRVPEVTETIGPIDGFRLKYTMHRREIALEPGRRSGAVGMYASLKYLTVIPTSSQMGEKLNDALAEGSDFRRALAKFHPGRSTVTIWTYQDSFDEFRRVKKELYRMGYETAGRPLPFGVPITASPEGSKSAAE